MNRDWSAAYWNGENPAGYSSPPQRQRILDTDNPHATGEVHRDRADWLVRQFDLRGKRVLEVGCAFGFLVEDLIELGVDAVGLDVSAYAIGQARHRRPDRAQAFHVADARQALAAFDECTFDCLISIELLACLTDAEVEAFFAASAVISRLQVHVTKDGTDPVEHYNPRPIDYYRKRARQLSPAARFVDVVTREVF